MSPVHSVILTSIALLSLSTASPVLGRPLGSADNRLPGAVIATSWYDEQDNTTSGRYVRLSTAADRQLVHHAWTWSGTSTLISRYVCYRAYDIAAGSFGPIDVLNGEAWGSGGFLDMAVTGDNRAVLTYVHTVSSSQMYRLWTSWDSAAGDANIVFTDYPPDSVNYYPPPTYKAPHWPRMAYIEGPTDTVLHIITQQAMQSPDPAPVYYFRRVGGDNESGVWDYPPRLFDTTFAWAAHQIAASPEGRVALMWMAKVPPDGAPDIASGDACAGSPCWDNDLYLQISNDNGITWENRINITRHTESPDIPYRAYSEMSALFDTSGVLHILWAEADWPRSAPPAGEIAQTGGMILHWSEAAPFATPVHVTDWNQAVCGGGIHPLNIGDVSIAECRGRLYALFVQFNDYEAGVMDDCADPAVRGFPNGAANGDLYLAVSADGGLTWDAPRNLTSTRSPGCNFQTAAGPCASEAWPSVTPRGSNTYIDPAISGAEIIVPAGGVDQGWYLDVQYVMDLSPGSAMNGEGNFVEVPIYWCRVACVDPIQYPVLAVAPDRIVYPAYAPHCTEALVPIVVSNLGAGDAEYAITAEGSDGPPGWLSADGLSGTLPAGATPDTGYAIINTGGAVCAPGSIVRLAGRLRIDSNDPESPHYIVIDVVVADTVCTPSADTVATTCLALQVFNDGGCGGRGHAGVSMDYSATDCDPSAEVYLADASPVIMVDTLINWAAYGCDYLSPYGLVPLGSERADSGAFAWYRATVTTQDTSLTIESEWYAPQAPDTCTFMIQRLRFFAADALTHTVTLGQVVDWDIPSDSGVRNGSDTLAGLPVIYQYGAEYGQDPGACQDNDRRMGAVFPLGMYRQTATHQAIAADPDNVWYGAQTRAVGANEGACGMDAFELGSALHQPGRQVYEAGNPDSAYTDLHTLVSFMADYPLVPSETLVVYTGFVTVQDGDTAILRARAEQARQWYCDHLVPDPPGCGCCQVRGDFNHDGEIKVSDLTSLISFLFRGGPGPVCAEEADANGDGGVKVSDLTHLIAFLFRGGPGPAPC